MDRSLFPSSTACRPKAAFVLGESYYNLVYGPKQRETIHRLADVATPVLSNATWQTRPDVTREVEWIFSSWSMPIVSEAFLAAFPKLRAIFYAAGTVKPFVTDALWEREIIVTSAFAANAIPVADFTIAQIVLSLKSFWRAAAQVRKEKAKAARQIPTPGVYGATVGLISLGMIGRLVAERLREFPVEVVAYDPFVSEETAAELGVRLCPLDEVFSMSDVVSCHTPWLKETERMLRKEHFQQMKLYATFINTARGAVVDEPGMIEVLTARPDLFALVDVTWPEPPVTGSPLYELPNLVLTPHIAGSKNNECWRLAQYMIDEAKRLLAGEPLQYAVTPKLLKLMA